MENFAVSRSSGLCRVWGAEYHGKQFINAATRPVGVGLGFVVVASRWMALGRRTVLTISDGADYGKLKLIHVEYIFFSRKNRRLI